MVPQSSTASNLHHTSSEGKEHIQDILTVHHSLHIIHCHIHTLELSSQS